MFREIKSDRYYRTEQDAAHPRGCSCRECMRQSGDTRPEWMRRADARQLPVRVAWSAEGMAL